MIKINPSILITGLLVMLIGTFLIQMITSRKVNGVTVKDSYFGYSGHSGALSKFFGDDD